MNRDLKIIFMGTPQFAVSSLNILVENEYNIVGVITAPDKPAGRGRSLQVSEVKKYALDRGLNILQPTNLKDQDFLNELGGLEANLQVVVAFRMLPEVVWSMPKYGTFNLHASLLPNYRGAAPIHWAIINGESKTGVTTFFIDEKIDTGEIILQEQVLIDESETVGELHDRLMDIGSQLVLKTVEQIKNGAVTTSQQINDTSLKSANKLNKENCRINWTEQLENVYNKIRGLNPFPTAWTKLFNGEEELDVKIYAVEKVKKDHNDCFGEITPTENALRVAVKNGYIDILEIKLPGKRKMDVKSLLNGYKIKRGAKML